MRRVAVVGVGVTKFGKHERTSAELFAEAAAEALADAELPVSAVQALYYGNAVNDQSLTPGDNPRLGSTGFEDWLSHNAEPVAAAAGGGR